MVEIGKRLIERLACAKVSVILAAPFIKLNVLRKLIESIPVDVELLCVTRWKVEEILAGVSDIEVWSLIKERPKSQLSLISNLHAKYYRIDDNCFVGSANLTKTALGWSPTPNLEFLVEISTQNDDAKAFETCLLANCISVDQNLYEEIAQKLENLKGWLPPFHIFDEDWSTFNEIYPDDHNVPVFDKWIPSLRNPEDLFLAYDTQVDKLTKISREYAQLDLDAFIIQKGFPRPIFEANIALQLLEKPILRNLDIFLETPRRFGEVTAFLQTKLDGIEDIDRTWQTIMRWLRYFLPDRYGLSIPRHTEVFYRRLKHD